MVAVSGAEKGSLSNIRPLLDPNKAGTASFNGTAVWGWVNAKYTDQAFPRFVIDNGDPIDVETIDANYDAGPGVSTKTFYLEMGDFIKEGSKVDIFLGETGYRLKGCPAIYYSAGWKERTPMNTPRDDVPTRPELEALFRAERAEANSRMEKLANEFRSLSQQNSSELSSVRQDLLASNREIRQEISACLAAIGQNFSSEIKLINQKIDNSDKNISNLRDDVKNGGRATRANIWAAFGIALASSIAIIALAATALPQAFTTGAFLRDTVKAEIKDQQQAVEASFQRAIDAAVQKAVKATREADAPPTPDPSKQPEAPKQPTAKPE